MRKKRLIVAAFALVLCFGCQKEEKPVSDQKADSKTDRQEESYSPIISEAEIDKEYDYPYEIKVNREENCITVYGRDDTGKYVIPVRAMICSTGGDETPSGTFQLGETSRWQMEADGGFSQYATRIVDDVAFHSAPYYSQNNKDLNVEQFNKMGQTISGSSIQLEVADARWIADNCPSGTKVEIYDAKEAGPLGRPEARKLESDARKDPTDTAKNKKKAKDYVPVVFQGIEDKVVGISQACDLLEGISAVDQEGQDLTARIQVFGAVDMTTPGNYEVIYICSNEEDESRAVKRSIQVTEIAAQPEAVSLDPVTSTASDHENSVPDSSRADTGSTVIFRDPSLISDVVSTPEPTPRPATAAPSQNTDSAALQSALSAAPPVQTVYRDTQAPVIEIVAQTRYVKDVKQATLADRIRTMDDSGMAADIYITVQPLEQDLYVIIYEAEDGAGNSSCISETVQVLDQTIFSLR